MTFSTNLYKKVGNKYIPGQFFRAFVWYRDSYVYEQLRVYADKTIAGTYIFYNLPVERIYKHISKFMPKMDKKYLTKMIGGFSDENMNAVPFEDFKYLLRKKLATFYYKGEIKIKLWDEPFTNLDDRYFLINVNETVSNDDYIKALEDFFCKLNNKQTTERLFLNALCEFLLSSKEKKELFRKKLYKAYLNVPKFQRKYIYVLSNEMEVKAKGKSKTPIEDILYKRKNRLDNYDEFVKVYDDGYFEQKYKELAKKT